MINVDERGMTVNVHTRSDIDYYMPRYDVTFKMMVRDPVYKTIYIKDTYSQPGWTIASDSIKVKGGKKDEPLEFVSARGDIYGKKVLSIESENSDFSNPKQVYP